MCGGASEAVNVCFPIIDAFFIRASPVGYVSNFK